MSLPSESIRSRRPSLAWAMALVAVAAADLAVLRAALPITLPIDPGANPSLPPKFWREHLPTLPDLGLVLTVLVLEAGLFRLFSRRGPERAFWLGFEVAGWAYVITCLTFARVAWRWSIRYSRETCWEDQWVPRPIWNDSSSLRAASIF
jgi:hypothetical protein